MKMENILYFQDNVPRTVRTSKQALWAVKPIEGKTTHVYASSKLLFMFQSSIQRMF
jgi:hypothetical protein